MPHGSYDRLINERVVSAQLDGIDINRGLDDADGLCRIALRVGDQVDATEFTFPDKRSCAYWLSGFVDGVAAQRSRR